MSHGLVGKPGSEALRPNSHRYMGKDRHSNSVSRHNALSADVAPNFERQQPEWNSAAKASCAQPKPKIRQMHGKDAMFFSNGKNKRRNKEEAVE